MTSWLRVTLFIFLTTAFLQCPKPVLGCTAVETKCIFDDIQSRVVSKSPVNYKSGRGKRSVGDLFQPIRIKASIRDLDAIVDTSDVERLKKIINGAISIISKILSVVPVADPLLMTRSESCRPFLVGNNTGKCAEVSPSYVGEECLDDLLIPNEHLEGLWIWNSTHPEPILQVYANGTGLADTDIVLYVKAEHTNKCNLGQIVAYAAYCKLDQNNRPIAGVINFCPMHLRDDLFDEPKFILLAVHEIFHVLGFSSSLFNKFKECTESADGLNCINRCTTVGCDAQGQPRLITPAVTAHAQMHYGCPESGFGGPLEKKSGDPAGCDFSSHWETRLMYGSLMAPVVNQPHQTFLDNLTLAVFEDSGWYKVNYEYGEDIPWGKNQGCEFGLESRCQTMPSQFFCNDSSTGCHYLHEDKATCSSNDYLEECRVMKANSEGRCSVQGDSSISVYGEEVFHENSRCFVSNAVSMESAVDHKGTCYLTRCDNHSRSYEVKVGAAEWQLCPQHTAITIPGYNGTVHCPSTEVICRQRTSVLDLVDVDCPDCLTTAVPSTAEPIAKTTPTTPNEHSLCITLEFEEIDYSILAGEEQLQVFSQAVIKGICNITNIHESRIIILEISQGSSAEREVDFVLVTFDITQAEEASDDIPAHVAYSDLQEAVMSNQLQVQFLNMKYTAVNIRIVSGDVPTSSFPENTAMTSDGYQATAIAVGVCLILFVMLCVLTGVWHMVKHSNAINPAEFDSSEDVAGERAPRLAYVVKEKTVTKL